MSEAPSPPRVFVSYSDDSPAHSRRVLELAQWLRSHGVDAQLDQFEDSPEEGWPRWIYRQIRESEFVLVIATPGYLRRCEHDEPRTNATDSAAKFGSHLSLQELHEAGGRNRKFVPVLFDDDAIVESVPLPLRGATCYRLPDERDDLYRRLTGQPKVQRAPLGVLKTFDDESLYDSMDEYAGEPGARARAGFDEQRADDSLRAVIDAGLLDDPEPRPRFRRSWLQTNRQWLISAGAFGLAFMAVGLYFGKRASTTPDDPRCRIQLTDDDGNVVSGIERVVLELPSGDEIKVVVEDGRTLEFACLSTAVQAQAHVFFRDDGDGKSNGVESSDPGDTPIAFAQQRIDGRVVLPDPAEAELVDGVFQAKIVEISRMQPPDQIAPPEPKPEPLTPAPSPGPAPGPGKIDGPKPSPTPKPTTTISTDSGDRQLAARLRDNQSALRGCYERGLARDPKLYGTLVASARIEPSGEVGGIEVEAKLDPELDRCVVALLDGWKLGKREGPRATVARVTIVFGLQGSVNAIKMNGDDGPLDGP